MIDSIAISWRYSNILPKCSVIYFLFVKLLTVWNATHATWDSHGSGSSDCKEVNSDTNTKTQVQNVDCTSCKVSAMDM